MKSYKRLFFTCASLLLFSIVPLQAQADALTDLVTRYTSRINRSNSIGKLNIPRHCFDDEKRVAKLNLSLIDQLKSAVLSQDTNQLKLLNFIPNEKPGPAVKPFRTNDGISEFRWINTSSQNLSDRIRGYKEINYVQIQILDYKIDSLNRDQLDNFSKIFLKLKLDVRGKSADGKKVQDLITLGALAVQKENKWSFRQIELVNGLTVVVNRKPYFSDITAASGLNSIIFPQRQYIREGGGFVVADFDGDKAPDLLFQIGTENQMWIGNKNGEFTKSKNAEKIPEYLDLSNGATVTADLNADGKLDSVHGPLNQIIDSSFKDHEVSANDFLADLQQVPKQSYKVAFDSSMQLQSLLAIDFDGNQNMDVLGIDQRGELKYLVKNEDSKTFIIPDSELASAPFSFASQIESADLNNDGLLDLAVADLNFNEFARLNATCTRHHSMNIFGTDNKGLKLFEGTKNGVSQIEFNSAADVGEAIAAIALFDYNNDGLVDIYVSNGLWSGDKQGQQSGEFLVALKREAREAISQIVGADNAIHFFEFLKGFRGKLLDFSDANSVERTEDRPSLAGFQRNRLFRNNGDGSYTDVAYLEDIDSEADGFGVAYFDFNRDGALDVILRNANPIDEKAASPVFQVYKNNAPTGRKAIVFELENSQIQKALSGLNVSAHLEKQKQLASLAGLNGSMNSQKIIHFGIGSNSKLSKAEVRWQGGSTKSISNVISGYHNLH